MKVAAVVSDLMFFSRIESAARTSGAELTRVDHPSSVPADTGLVLVDWSIRDESWVLPLHAMRDAGARVVLFGPHVDLDAHAAAKAAGMGPMWARSRVFSSLASLLDAAGGEARKDERDG